MATLKEISHQLADALNRPFDDMLIERLKVLIRQELATLIRQQINKYGISSQFKTRYSIKCKDVELGDSPYYPGHESDVEVYRTVNKVARPVRYTTDEPFTYVGSTNGQVPFIFINIAELPYVDALPSIQKTYQVEDTPVELPIRYSYDNNYIYIYGDIDSLKVDDELFLTIEGVHSSYDFINTETADSTTLRYLDTVDFPMPDDLIQTIKGKLLAGELGIIDAKDKIPSRHIDNN